MIAMVYQKLLWLNGNIVAGNQWGIFSKSLCIAPNWEIWCYQMTYTSWQGQRTSLFPILPFSSRGLLILWLSAFKDRLHGAAVLAKKKMNPWYDALVLTLKDKLSLPPHDSFLIYRVFHADCHKRNRHCFWPKWASWKTKKDLKCTLIPIFVQQS